MTKLSKGQTVDSRHEVSCRGCGDAVVYEEGKDGARVACDPPLLRVLWRGVEIEARQIHRTHCSAGRNGESR